jgi:hypothetical protein
MYDRSMPSGRYFNGGFLVLMSGILLLGQSAALTLLHRDGGCHASDIKK